jgi:hypothetical protein
MLLAMPVKNSRKAEIASRIREAGARALAEAEARRKNLPDHLATQVPEVNGPKGLEPTRYGDWEHKGIASDF